MSLNFVSWLMLSWVRSGGSQMLGHRNHLVIPDRPSWLWVWEAWMMTGGDGDLTIVSSLTLNTWTEKWEHQPISVSMPPHSYPCPLIPSHSPPWPHPSGRKLPERQSYFPNMTHSESTPDCIFYLRVHALLPSMGMCYGARNRGGRGSGPITSLQAQPRSWFTMGCRAHTRLIPPSKPFQEPILQTEHL